MEEIAAVVGCSVDTLERRFAEVIKTGKDTGKSSLRRLMWSKAQDGNVALMIWLSKQHLGMTDKQIIEDNRPGAAALLNYKVPPAPETVK